MSLFQALIDRVLGRSDAGVGVPAMDGVFKPNTVLESAELIVDVPNIDSLASTGDRLFCSSGNELIQIEFSKSNAKAKTIRSFEGAITFLTARDDGVVAVGVAGQGIQLGKLDNLKSAALSPAQQSCLTAASFGNDGKLYATVGSTQHAATDWKRDLMSGLPTGELLSIDPATSNVAAIARNLAYPNGVVAMADGRLAMSESWRHRVVSIGSMGKAEAILEDLPAYPSRLTRSDDGGFWLSLFAPRRQLFEFILREDEFRRSMQSEVDPSEWVGPDLSSSIAPDQPMTKGLVRQMGILKPWAPSQSYGLIAKLDASGEVVQSYHSRADGQYHGITDVCEFGGSVYVACKGYGALLKLPVLKTSGAA
jgi:hypothetical protein